MIESLEISNFAIIDSSSIEFSRGLTVLTGETGAGKSILIGALSFLLGGKSDSSAIRAGSQQASVSAAFSIGESQKAARMWLSERDIELDDGKIILRRTIRDTGKSAAWIGSVPVSRAELSEFSSFLVDIHGQHEHQSLMKVGEHRKFLDSFAKIEGEVEKFTALYNLLVEKRKSLQELNVSEEELSRRIELLQFAVGEIDEAQIRSGEEEDLESEESRLSQFERLYSQADSLSQGLQGEQGIVAQMKRLRQIFSAAASTDKSLEKNAMRFESAFYEVSDIADEAASYKEALVFDPARLAEVQDRLALFSRLKKKYAPSGAAEDLLAFRDKAQKELDALSERSGGKKNLEAEIAEIERKIFSSGSAISEKRRAASADMSGQIERVLSELGMRGAKFSVSLSKKYGDEKEQKCGPYGFDDIEFLISANVGSPLASLAKIASGGEISRVMLAIKTVLADSDEVPTLIFDEIDAGIGGEVALSLGRHLRALAESRQALCITHLASIASFADNQIKIEKTSAQGATKTAAFAVSGESRVAEIARMLSGDPESAASLDHAREILAKNCEKRSGK